MTVVKRGYEDGYNDIDVDDCRQIPIARKANPRRWEGQYNDPDRIKIGKTVKADRTALLII